jgi:hypothetical protein
MIFITNDKNLCTFWKLYFKIFLSQLYFTYFIFLVEGGGSGIQGRGGGRGIQGIKMQVK